MIYILKISKSSIENHFYELGCINYFDVWVPHKLIQKTKKTFLAIVPHEILYLNATEILFLKQIVTGDEKYILYNIVEQKIS